MPHELAGKLSMVLRQRMLRLQQQQLAALEVDRVYDDRRSDAISEELWTKESGLQEQLRRVRAEIERPDGASQAYETAGLQTLELARSAYTSDIRKDPHAQAPHENSRIELHVRS